MPSDYKKYSPEEVRKALIRLAELDPDNKDRLEGLDLEKLEELHPRLAAVFHAGLAIYAGKSDLYGNYPDNVSGQQVRLVFYRNFLELERKFVRIKTFCERFLLGKTKQKGYGLESREDLLELSKTLSDTMVYAAMGLLLLAEYGEVEGKDNNGEELFKRKAFLPEEPRTKYTDEEVDEMIAKGEKPEHDRLTTSQITRVMEGRKKK